MDLFDFQLSEKEKPFSCAAETLGVVLDTSDPSMASIFIANKPERAAMLEQSLGRILASGRLETKELPSLLGKLRFADAQLLGRTGRLALPDLRTLSDRTGSVEVTESQANALAVLRARLLASRPRAIATSPPSSPVVIFTDGACEPSGDSFETGVGGVIFIPRTKEVRVFGCWVPPKLVAQWGEGRKHVIGQVELYAVVLARTLWSDYVNNERCIFFVDHSGVLSACINSNSIDASWRSLLLHLEAADEAHPCLPWFHRVPSQSNIADHHRRGASGVSLDSLGHTFAMHRLALCPVRGLLQHSHSREGEGFCAMLHPTVRRALSVPCTCVQNTWHSKCPHMHSTCISFFRKLPRLSAVP